MRLLLIIIVVLFAAAGVVFGALNADLVSYDLVFTRFAMPKGAALLGMLLIGWVLGGLLVWLFAVQPLKRKLARTRRQIPAIESANEDDPQTASA
ncbi:MAG: LapA family protein [Rhodanobacteraceae bacterium]